MSDIDVDDFSAGALTDDPVVNEAMKRWTRVQEWESIARQRFLDDLKFRHGDSDNGYQWPGAIKNLRDADNRPCLTMNVIRQHNLIISNEARKNKSSVKFKAMGNGATQESANVFADIMRHIEDKSRAQNAYTLARNFQIDGGMGWVRLVTDYESPDSFDQAIYILPVRDPLSVYLDPDRTQDDYSDAKWGFVFDWVPKDEFREAYPDFVDLGVDAPLGSGTIANAWDAKNHVNICEYFRKVKKKDKLVSFEHMGERKTVRHSKLHKSLHGMLKDPATRVRDVEDEVVEWYLIVGQEIVDSTIWPGRYIPLIPVLGEEVVLDGILDRKGHTRAMKDAQRMYNYNASGQVEFGALQSKTPWIAAAKAIEQFEDIWNTANKINHSVLVYNHVDDEGNPVAPPMRIDPPAGSPLFASGMETAFNQMMMTSGQWQNQMGMLGNERTGAAIGKRQEQGDTATYHFQDNYEKALINLGKQIIDLVPKVYDTKRVLKMMAEDGVDYDLVIDPTQRESYYQELSHDNEVVKRIFNPQVGQYDIASSTGPAYGSKREKTVEALTLILTQNPALTSIIGDILLSAMDFDKADEAARRLRRMVPQQALGNGPTPTEQQQAQQIQQLSALLQQQLQEAGHAKLAHDRDRLKLVGKAEMRDIDVYKAETDRMKALQDQLPMDPEGLRQMVKKLMDEAQVDGMEGIVKGNEGTIADGSGDVGTGGAGRVMATTSEGPGAGTVMAPPLPHARKAPDGHYYIPDPTRPGKHIKLTPREQ